MTRTYTHKAEPPDRAGPLGFGGRLYRLRTGRRLSRRELAVATHTSDTAIALWENGVSFPGYWNLIEVSKYFNVTADWLIGITYTHQGVAA